MSRFEPFDDEELREMWYALTFDDGIQYGISDDDQPSRRLADEMVEAAKARGLELRDADFV
jgi:hypothetical protein